MAAGMRHWLHIGFACAVGVLLLGCAPSAVFYGDPALRQIVGAVDRFEDGLMRAADAAGHRLVIEWDPGSDLSTSWLESRLAGPQAPLAVLSPYFSLFATDLARANPTVEFVAFAPDGTPATNLVRIEFDRVSAMEQAGAMVREWVQMESGRRAGVLHLVRPRVRLDELEAFETGYGVETQSDLLVLRFDVAPDRESVRREIRDLLAEGVNAFLLFIGPSNRFALEMLQSEAVVFATDYAAATVGNDALLLSIEDPMDQATKRGLDALDAGDQGLVTVDSIVVQGPGYSNPQLQRKSAGEPSEKSTDSQQYARPGQ